MPLLPPLIGQLATRCQQSLPGRAARERFAPAGSYGRYFGPGLVTSRPAAVLILLYPRGEEWFIPLTLRPSHMKQHGGQVSLPGGAVEPGESSEQAALREFTEELGVLPKVQWIGRLSTSYLFASDFLVTPCLAWCRYLPPLEPNPQEVEQAIELPVAALSDARNFRNVSVCLAPGHASHRQLTVPAICWESHVVWGATAIVLGELAAML